MISSKNKLIKRKRNYEVYLREKLYKSLNDTIAVLARRYDEAIS